MVKPLVNKTFISLFALAFSVLSSIRPAWCDTQSSSSQATNAQPEKSLRSHITAAPKSIAGFCAGFVVGTPICFLRKLPQEVSEGGHGFVGSIIKNSDNKFLLIPAELAYLPFACCWAFAEAPGYALRDAWMAEKPFSKEQFSLAELDKGDAGK